MNLLLRFVIFRFHRGSLRESMKTAMVFLDESIMKSYIASKENIPVEDVIIDEESFCDERVGWLDSHMVRAREGYAIGYYATQFPEHFPKPETLDMTIADHIRAMDDAHLHHYLWGIQWEAINKGTASRDEWHKFLDSKIPLRPFTIRGCKCYILGLDISVDAEGVTTLTATEEEVKE